MKNGQTLAVQLVRTSIFVIFAINH